jgi:hypothetical protein
MDPQKCIPLLAPMPEEADLGKTLGRKDGSDSAADAMGLLI